MAKAKKEKPGYALIRATSADDIKLLKDLKRSTGERTNSKALLTAAARYLVAQEQINAQEKEINGLEKQLQELQEIVKFTYHANSMMQSYAKKHFPAGKYPQSTLF